MGVPEVWILSSPLIVIPYQKTAVIVKKKLSIPFLDTQLSIIDGRIDVDLYRKKTDQNQYLLPSSCHSKMTTVSIPYSLNLRIVRICTNPSNREKRFSELKNLLLERGYNERQINSSINKARLVSREAALRKVKRKESNQGPVFCSNF